MIIARQWFVHRMSNSHRSSRLPRKLSHPSKLFPPHHKMRQKILPSEGFLDKGIRLANSATSLIGSAKGIYEAGRFVYSGLQAARPLLALM